MAQKPKTNPAFKKFQQPEPPLYQKLLPWLIIAAAIFGIVLLYTMSPPEKEIICSGAHTMTSWGSCRGE